MADVDRMALRAFRHLIEERTGLLMAAEREADLAAAIQDGAASADPATHRDYFARLEAGPDAAGLLARLVQRLVPQETYFFRDRSQLHAAIARLYRPEAETETMLAGLLDLLEGLVGDGALLVVRRDALPPGPGHTRRPCPAAPDRAVGRVLVLE